MLYSNFNIDYFKFTLSNVLLFIAISSLEVFRLYILYFADIGHQSVVVGYLGHMWGPFFPRRKDQTQPLQWERGGTLTPQPWRPLPKPTSLLGEASLQFLKIKSTLNLNLANFVTVCITCLKILDMC